MIILDLPSLGARVRERRLELGLSQSELAESVGTTRQWLSRLEQGREGGSVARLLDVCDALDLVIELREPSRPRATPEQRQSLLSPATLQALSTSLTFIQPNLWLELQGRFPDLETQLQDAVPTARKAFAAPAFREALARIAGDDSDGDRDPSETLEDRPHEEAGPDRRSVSRDAES